MSNFCTSFPLFSLLLSKYDLVFFVFFFFKKKTAYERLISDWSSDVCSSDLYKAGGYNLDRSGLNPDSISVADLRFAPEKVDAYELGLKLDLRRFRFSAALFYQKFEQFQLNTFNGISFVVENVQSCKEALTPVVGRSEEHTSELQSLMRISYAVFCLKKKK